MQFGNPQALWLLLLWPVLAVLGWGALRWRTRAAGRLGSRELIERLYPASSRAWRRRRLALGLAASALLMLAAARPQYGQIEKSVQSYGANVMIALDCSRSMLAQDVKPNRIQAAQQSLAWFLRALQGNRVGVEAFAGDAVLNCPMTLDTDMALRILNALDTQAVGVQGTDLGRAIDVATGAFTRGAGEGGRVLVLITDGEDNEGKGLQAAKRAAKEGVVIDAIGIGTERGAPIQQATGGFLENQSGQKVNTRMRMDTLEAIAKATGGKAFAAGDDPQSAITQIVGQINSMKASELASRKRIIHQDRFAWFVAPALLLLVWMLASSPEPRRPRWFQALRTSAPRELNEK